MNPRLILAGFAASLCLALGLVLVGLRHTPVLADEAAASEYPQHAGLVVDFGNGAVITRCVDLGQDAKSSALEVLETARPTLTLQIETFMTSANVCQIEDTGCPADQCTTCAAACAEGVPGACQAFNTWRHYQLREGKWTTPTGDVRRAEVLSGTVEGWRWGRSSYTGVYTEPPVLSFEQICVSQIITPTATPTNSPTPTLSPTLTATPFSGLNAPTDTPIPTATLTPTDRPDLDRRREAPAPAVQPVENPVGTITPTATITPRPQTEVPRNVVRTAVAVTAVAPADQAGTGGGDTVLPIVPGQPDQPPPEPPTDVPPPPEPPTDVPPPPEPPTDVPPPLEPPTDVPPPPEPPTDVPPPTPDLLQTELAILPRTATPTPASVGAVAPAPPPAAPEPPAVPPTPVPDVIGEPSGVFTPPLIVTSEADVLGPPASPPGGWLLYIFIGLMLVLFLVLLVVLQIRAMRGEE